MFTKELESGTIMTLRSTVKHGGAPCKFGAAFLLNGLGDVVRINGVLDVEKYRQTVALYF